MKKIALPALAAVSMFALAACGDADETAPAGEAEGTLAEPAGTYEPAETGADTDVDAGADANLDADVEGDGDTVSINKDGVNADIRDGNTRVQADIDDDPSVTVTD